MDNLTYLHLIDAQNSPPETLDWGKFPSVTWRYILPWILILSSVNSVWALERGDQGPSVRKLQLKLQGLGLYQAPITQVYDFTTEEAVRKFQQANGLPVDGVAGIETQQKLRVAKLNPNGQFPQLGTASTPLATNVSTTKVPTIEPKIQIQEKRKSPHVLARGDEGQDVVVLQQRLKVAGFYAGRPTGVFGPVTEDAVRRFQMAHKLDVDGIVGAGTLGKLPPMGIGGEESPKVSTAVKNKDFLSIGDRGLPVRVLQEQLIHAGYLKGSPNGYFGAYTADAVKRFQGANYLAVSGIAGPTTRAKLHQVINSNQQGQISVLEIQKRLKEKGFYQGPLDGVMGEETETAIKKAQQFYGVSVGDIRNGIF